MIRKSIFILSLLITTIICQAQQVLTGTLLDTDNTPIEFANIVLLAKADSTFITGTVSSENGGFTLSLPQSDIQAFLIRVTSIGYTSICQPVQVASMGVMRMEADALMLDEVVVKADLPVTRLKGDAMVTNIEGTVLAKAGTAQDMLNYIPGVASQKGSLEVLGRGAPIVYINGRLMRNSSELDQLSSDDILSVEVVNNPGARYDATVKGSDSDSDKKISG